MITHCDLKQCLRRFQIMRNHGYVTCSSGGCTHTWLPRSICRILPRSIEQFSWQRRPMWQYSYRGDLELVGVAVPNSRRRRLAGAKPNNVNAGHSKGSFSYGQKQKPNKNFYYRGQNSGNPTRGGYQPQVNQTAPPPPRVVPMNPGPQWGGGPGPRRGGRGNQRRPRTAGVRVIQEDTVMEQEVMAGQQGQGSGQQPERKGTTVSQRQRQGN